MHLKSDVKTLNSVVTSFMRYQEKHGMMILEGNINVINKRKNDIMIFNHF